MVKKSNRFILHLLSHDQKSFATSFFKSTHSEDNLINGQSFKMVDDLPVLELPPAYLVCSVIDLIESCDHPLFLAEVKDAVVRDKIAPLELRKTGWSYGG